jgi:general nucleoside transport system permease protein
MRIRLEPRLRPSPLALYGTPVLAVALSVLSGMVLFAALGHDPVRSVVTFFIAPITTVYGFSELLVKATPIVLCAVGLALAFRANVWNIGAEGQLIAGAVTSGGVALAFHDSESGWVLPGMVLAGALGGAAWAALPALFKTRWNASEILTSLMLVYVAELGLRYLVHGPWKDPTGVGFPETRTFAESALLPLIWSGTRLHLGALVALAAVGLCWLVLARTLVGYRIRIVGSAPRAAAFAGFSPSRMVWLTMLASGALAGLAGTFEASGPMGQLVPSISPGYGFTAIIVAFVGRLHPVGVLLAGLLVALSYLGGEHVQIVLGMPVAVAGVFQGMLLFFLLASDLLVRYRVRLGPAVGSAAT